MRLRPASCFAVLATATLALAAAASPAGAGEEQPHPLETICGMSPHPGDADGAVASLSGQFIGQEIWNVTAEDQEIGVALLPGSAARFEVRFFNDDDIAHDIVVRGDLDGQFPPPGIVIKVFRETNRKDVTDKVFGLSGLRFRDIDVGSPTADLVVRIKLQANAPSNAFVSAFISGNYEVASVCGDTVGVFGGAP